MSRGEVLGFTTGLSVLSGFPVPWRVCRTTAAGFWISLSLLSFCYTLNACEQPEIQSLHVDHQHTSSVMAAVSSSNTAFALELLRTLSKGNPTGNIFVSPLSISSALAMVYLGAKGETATQMAQALSFSSGEGVHADFETLNADINSSAASYILKLANRLYGESTSKFLPEFLDATQKYYHADLKTVDFIGAAEDCRGEINSWVEQQTENKIKELLKPGTVTPMTRLALVNAIYFKGNWMNRFDAANTKEMPFKTNNNESIPVQMMYQMKKLPYNYIPEFNLQILELPYVEDELSMFILLPEPGSEFLSAVAHKAFVEVNEEGTEAAAATAGMVAFCMLREEHFTADHPFLFFIRHNKTKSILFLGRFSSPQ